MTSYSKFFCLIDIVQWMFLVLTNTCLTGGKKRKKTTHRLNGFRSNKELTLEVVGLEGIP